jgi:hypothetical protein
MMWVQKEQSMWVYFFERVFSSFRCLTSSSYSLDLPLENRTHEAISTPKILLSHSKLTSKPSRYFALGASALVSEAILQILSAVYLFQTVHFAASNGYYLIHTPITSVPGGQAALMMYIGALLWAVSIGAAILQITWSFLGVGRVVRRFGGEAKEEAAKKVEKVEDSVRRRFMIKFSKSLPKALNFLKGLGLAVQKRQAIAYSAMVLGSSVVAAPAGGCAAYGMSGVGGQDAANADWEMELHDMGLSIKSIARMQSVVGWMIVPFLGQWLFWVGLVRLFGERYGVLLLPISSSTNMKIPFFVFKVDKWE